MKFLKISMLFIIAAVLMVSCSKDDDNTPNNTNEVENLQLVKSFADNGYTVELFNNSGNLKVGYNKIYLRLTDKNGNYVKQSTITWMPMMTMDMGGMTYQHSCPFSDISKVSGKQTLFEGYIVFVMPSDNPMTTWDLKINYTVDGQNIETNGNVDVISTQSQSNKTFTSVTGSDSTTYMLALVEPTNPKMGTNDFVVALFKEESQHHFPIVDNYKIKVDPRMPGMGNHGTSGNEDLTQRSDGFYHGKVSFSMSGDWVINLILENDSGTVIKGEPVTQQNPESSLNLKLGF